MDVFTVVVVVGTVGIRQPYEGGEGERLWLPKNECGLEFVEE
jgi:hypothetical protein